MISINRTILRKNSLRFGYVGAIVATQATCSVGALAGQRSQGHEREVISPRIPQLDDRRIAFTLPKGWRIARKDPIEQWRLHVYSLDVRVPTHSKLSPSSLVELSLDRYAMVRAKRHGVLVGKQLLNSQGRRGFFQFRKNDAEWDYILPANDKFVLWFSVSSNSLGNSRLNADVIDLFQSLRLTR